MIGLAAKAYHAAVDQANNSTAKRIIYAAYYKERRSKAVKDDNSDNLEQKKPNVVADIPAKASNESISIDSLVVDESKSDKSSN